MGDETSDMPSTMTMEQLSSKVDKIALQITAIVDAMGVSDEDKEKIKSLAMGGRRRRRSRRGKRPRKSRRSRRH
jgi:hypothetical protein